jgi:hypothetical protein
MRFASSIVLITCTMILLLVADPSPRAVPSGRDVRVSHPATIEPTLPLLIDLQFEHLKRTPQGWIGLLRVTLEAARRFPEISLHLNLPEGVRADAGDWLTEFRSLRLETGEKRVHAIPLSIAAEGAFPIRLEAVVDLSDGKTFRTQQGRTLRLGRSAEDGRYHLGAYEVMAVPVEDLPQ